MIEITEYPEQQLSESVAWPIARLCSSAFGASGMNPEQRVQEMLDAAQRNELQDLSGRRFVIWDNDRPVAHARTFIRIIKSNQVELPVLALASVCTDLEQRGRGLGATITRRALEQVGRDNWPRVSLFQTPVPEFYQRLNCQIVNNQFVNRRGTDPDANPWRDETIMIYPAGFAWPEGLVDLNGPDY